MKNFKVENLIKIYTINALIKKRRQLQVETTSNFNVEKTFDFVKMNQRLNLALFQRRNTTLFQRWNMTFYRCYQCRVVLLVRTLVLAKYCIGA